MAGNSIIILDPATGAVDFEWVPYETGDGSTLLLSSIDHDLRDEFDWATYRITNVIIQRNSLADEAVLSALDIVLDDGSRVLREIDYYWRDTAPGSEVETRFDAQGRTLTIERTNLAPLWEFSFERFFAYREQRVAYDADSGNISSVTTLHHDGRVEVIEYDPASGQRSYPFHLRDGTPPGGPQPGAGEAETGLVTARRVTAADGSILDERYDSQGRLDYAVERPAAGGLRATAYDLADDQPWARYSSEYQIIDLATIDSRLLTGANAVMDDGRRVELAIAYFQLDLDNTVRGSETYTVKDAQGRILSVDQTNLTPPIGPPIEQVFAFRQQSIVYDAQSGRIDFIATLSLGGDRESIDYDPATGQRDYRYLQQADGGTVSEDYNPANGVLDYRRITGADGSSLDEDYDSQGRLDYAVERLADGRMRVTDYDLADQHGWSSTSILYAASGAIESITVL